jgi:hypothetical protein
MCAAPDHWMTLKMADGQWAALCLRRCAEQAFSLGPALRYAVPHSGRQLALNVGQPRGSRLCHT